MYSGKLRNAVFLAAVILVLSSFASAAWSMNTLTEPYNHLKVSNDTQTVKVIELTDSNGDPVNIDMLENDPASLNYIYNASSGPRVAMEWLHSGYYFAKFDTNSTNGTYIEYELNDPDDSNYDEVNQTQQMNFGNLSVSFEEATDDGEALDLSSKVKFGKYFTLNVSVNDDWNDTAEDQAKITAYFTNMTSSGEMVKYAEMGYNNGYYTQSLQFPEASNSSYVLWINASRSSAAYSNAHGSTGVIVRTLPQVKGEITELETSSGCNNQSFFTECEWGTTINTTYDITSSTANTVNLSLELKEESSGNWVHHSNVSLEKQNGEWKGQIKVPDFNTSKYQEEFRLRYNATNNERTHIDTYSIDYRTFVINRRSDSITPPGDYNLKIEFSKYFTPNPLNNTRMDADINVTKPSGGELASFTLDDMTYSQVNGLFKKKVNVPFDGETGIYNVKVNATNKWGYRNVETLSFNVSDVEKTFELDDTDREIDYDKTGSHEFNVTLENLLGSENTFTTSLSDFDDSLDISVNDGEDIVIGAEETENVTVEINVSYVDDYSGEIKFMDEDSNYNSTLDVELNAPSCDYRNQTICLQADADYSVSDDERGYISRFFTVYYLGAQDGEEDIDVTSTGNISNYLDIEPSSFELNPENETRSVLLNYSVQAPGFYNGTLRVEGDNWTEFDVSLDSGVESTDSSIQLPNSIDLGYIPSNSKVEHEFDVTNSGDVAINELSFSSTAYSVSMIVDGSETSSIELSPGETRTVTLEFAAVTEQSGTITADVSTSFEDYTRDISVSANPVPDYEERAGELDSRLTSLDMQVESDSQYQSTISDLQTKIEDIKTAYQSENYEEAETLYNEVEYDISDLERQVSSTTDNPDDEPDRPGTGSGPGTGEEQSGSGFIMIAAVIVILLLIGFVAYTSLIPEEGDPLYDVLGK